MNIKDLEYFLSVAECGSFSKASAALGRPQPALSRHIRDLETALRVQLLYRNGRGVVMTDAGRCLLERGTEIVQRIAETQALVASYSGHYVSSAAIGMPPSLAGLLTTPLVHSLRTLNNDLQLRIVDAFNGDLLQGITSGSLDVAIMYDVNAASCNNAEPILSQPLSLITNDDALFGDYDDVVEAKSLKTLPLILPSKRHGLRHIVENWAIKFGIPISTTMECDSYTSLLKLVADGVGCTILPASALRKEITTGALEARLIVKPDLCRTMSLATSPNKQVSRHLVQKIKETVDNLKPAFLWPLEKSDHSAKPAKTDGLYPRHATHHEPLALAI